MFSWIRRLFGKQQPTGPAGALVPAATTDATTIAPSQVPAAADPGVVHITIVDDLSTRSGGVPVAVPTMRAEPSFSERLTAQLAVVERLRAEHPVASQQPDASALLQMLQDGPDALIRQLPAAARDTMALVDDQSLSRSRLAEALGRDPALVQGLLRAANSAAFGAGRDAVLSVSQALDRIGVTGTRAVVLASCVDGLLSHPGGEYNVMASQVWSHMVRTAPLARVVAPAFAADADEAFAVALLHDVGKLAIFDRMSVLRGSRRRPLVLDTSFVHELLQLLHEPLGALAADRWGMGARAASAIGQHHRTQPMSSRDTLAESLYLAERADHAARKNQPLDLDGLWAAGRLTGSPARAGDALRRVTLAA